MGRPRKKPTGFKEGQLVEPIEAYAGEINGVFYAGYPGQTRIDGGSPAAREWPHLHKLVDPNAYKETE